jgi:hypothetical protein
MFSPLIASQKIDVHRIMGVPTAHILAHLLLFPSMKASWCTLAIGTPQA